MNSLLISVCLIGISIFSLSVSPIFGQNFTDSILDKERVSTLNFSVKPLDNWAYGNAKYAAENIFGFGINNAVEMRPNQFDNFSIVYALIAKDDYFSLKNAGLNSYVIYKMNDTNLKYLDESQLLSKENIKIINGTTDAVKLVYHNPNEQLKLALFLLNHNKEPYLMFYWAKTGLFDKYLPEFEQMINTIKWIDV